MTWNLFDYFTIAIYVTYWLFTVGGQLEYSLQNLSVQSINYERALAVKMMVYTNSLDERRRRNG